MDRRHDDPAAIRETRVVHEVHRRATSLLADVTGRPAAPPEAAELRDFVVATLRHHHHCEDADLWPLLQSTAPLLTEALGALSVEHARLDEQLDQLQGVSIGDGADPARARARAVAVRDLVHGHLAGEEPVLFPALWRYVSAPVWDGFSVRAVASTPPESTPLLVAFLHEVGAPEDLASIFRHLPPPARELLPAKREEGRTILAALRRQPAGATAATTRRPGAPA
jgi:hemerythrin-like domain-containing protein